ncbi:MAG: hypothetical protein DME55_07800 [Verrucomicrobia bacterium]|nr:MAG: hypothetical protein DME55_07800 [Verrucomicrobiota bacterium]
MPEELDQPATKRDLHDLGVVLIDRMQRVEREQLSLSENVAKLRNSMWLNIVVPSLTLLVSLVIHYLFH